MIKWLLKKGQSHQVSWHISVLVNAGFMYVHIRRMLIVRNDERINLLPTLYWWRIVATGKRKKELLHLV